MNARLESAPFGSDELAKLQECTYGYFLSETHRANGMVPDSTKKGSAASIAAIGFGLTAHTVGVERGYLTRADAIERTLVTLRFFWNSEQSKSPEATGYRGFYYHFLDMKTGRRAGKSELSTIDTTFLLAGFLTAAMYFDRETKREAEIRTLAHALYARADWHWAQNGALAVAHGWKPETGFIKHRWEGYSEALILYLLGLGSPTFPLPAESYAAWTRSYQWRKLYEIECLYAGPLFIHQLSHLWVDFRDIQDDYMRARGIDYFENSRRFVYIQQAYAIANPKGFAGYGEYAWASPPAMARARRGARSRAWRASSSTYTARSIPSGPDDGTLAPWAVVASLPFARSSCCRRSDTSTPPTPR